MNEEAERWMEPPEVTNPAPPNPWIRAREMGLPLAVEPPMTAAELESAMAVPAHSRRWDPFKCLYNEHPKDLAIFDYAQCRAVLPDPTRIRYCLKHALELKYPMSPEEVEELAKAEARIGLQGLTPRAVETLREVMADLDAPAGARANAAVSVLDRTGFHARADLDVKVGATVIDMTGIIKERLAAKREALGKAGVVLPGELVVPELAGDVNVSPNGDGA